MVDAKTYSNWQISIQNKNGISSIVSEGIEIADRYASATSGLNEAVEIVRDKELILENYLFEDSDVLSAYPPQYFTEHPETLKDYDYVYLVKCQFSKK